MLFPRRALPLLACAPARLDLALALGVGLGLALCTHALPVRAQAAPEPAPADDASTPPACTFERYISVSAAGEFDAALAEEVRKDLAAELAARGLGVCPSRAAQGELVAEVILVPREADLVAIQVEDYTTGKRLARDVRLARIPAGGVALALAIATDELLRASWAELMLRRKFDQPPAQEEEPVSVYGMVAVKPRAVPVQKPSTPIALALALDYAHTRSQWDGFGFEARLQLRPLRHGFVEVGGGGGLALPVQGELGTARAAFARGTLTLGGCGQPEASIALCGGARGTFQWTRFRGTDAQAAEGREADLTSFVLSALGQAQVRLSERFFLLGEFSLGGALVSARVSDGEQTLLGIEGVVVSFAFGLGVRL